MTWGTCPQDQGKGQSTDSSRRAAPLFHKAAEDAGYNRIWDVSSLPAAVKLAHKIAQPGDIVLLSPGCASWDMFRDYEERANFSVQRLRNCEGGVKMKKGRRALILYCSLLYYCY